MIRAMDVTVAALVAYGVVGAYLLTRGVEVRRIAVIAAMGLAGGLLLAATVGMVYFAIVLVKPVQTIAVFSILSLLFMAAHWARQEILGTITPLGIVLLNVAANLAPWYGALPLSLAGLAQLIPVPPGPVRTVLNLLVLYAPSLAALWLLWRGPPGSARLRFLLGAWAVWVGIAAVAGPGWSLVEGSGDRDPARWMAAGFAAFAAMHLVLLALNLMIAVSDETGEASRSIAHSVRVDRMPMKWVVGAGVAFWVAAYIGVRLAIAIDFAVTSAALLAAAFGLASILSRAAPVARDDAPPAGSLSLAAPLAAYGAVFAGFALLVWWSADPAARAAANRPVNPTTGTSIGYERQPGLRARYEEPDLHEEMKALFAQANIPFTTQRIGGKEYVMVDEAHRAAAKEALKAIEGELPGGGGVQFRDPAREKAYTDWLEAHGVKWRKVRRRHEHFLVVDDGPRHGWLARAFDDELLAKSANVDYHALYVVRQDANPLLADGVAAFRSTESQERFVKWLEGQGASPRVVSSGPGGFVEWQPLKPKLLEEYIRHASHQCWLAERERLGAPPPAGRC